MKFRIVLFLIFLLLLVFPVAAAESEWALDTMEKLEKWTAHSNMLQYEIKNGKCEFVPMGDKPYISYNFENQGPELSEFKYAALRMNSDTVGYRAKLVVESENGTFEAEKELLGDSEWQNIVFELLGEGKIRKLKLYFLSDGYADATAHILIDRIGLFENTDKSEYFLNRELISLKEQEIYFTPDGIRAPQWLFSNSTDIAKWDISGDTYIQQGSLKIKSDEHNITLSHIFEQCFNAREFPYFALRCKADNHGGMAYITFNNLPVRSYFVLKNNGAWQNIVIDMTKYSHRLWDGIISNILFTSESSQEISIERIGFFSSYYDASAFLQESASEDDFADGKVFKGSDYKITVLPDKITQPYTLEDVLVNRADEMINGGNCVVVLVNDEPVALSEVTDRGYIVYYAQKTGEYTLGNCEKQYSDTFEHWGKEYIDYTSARGLFSGTSPTEFSPDMTITRGMFITVLGRMHGVDIQSVGNHTRYSDVESWEYYAPYIKWAADNGIFAPEGDCFNPMEPISRGEMALVISNYVTYGGYTFNRVTPTVQFEDIYKCNDQIREAILNIQSLSIINGKSLWAFDPHGTCTRAEASTVFTRLIKSILGVFYTSPYDLQYFENDKIRIGAFANFDTDVLNQNLLDAYASAGFNTMLMTNETAESPKRDMILDFCDKNGINVVMPYDTDYFTSSLEYFHRPCFYGSFIAEEPGSEQFDEVGKIVNAYSQKMMNKKVLVNLLPMYSSSEQLRYGGTADYYGYYDADAALYREYCERYAQGVETDTLMINVMPYTSRGLYGEYIENISIASDTAKKYGKTLWCMIQSDTCITDKNQFLRQYYTLMSFGCHNFVLWLWSEGICDSYSRTTPTFYAAQSANAELNLISEVFVKYHNIATAVYNPDKQYDSTLYGNILSGVPGISELISTQPVLTGEFKNQIGKSAYTFVNISETGSSQIMVKLPCDTVTIYFDGVPQIFTPDTEGYFVFTLLAGQGVFVTE